MENIFKQRASSSTEYVEKPKIKNLTKEFLIKLRNISQVQKIDLIYSSLMMKKPDPSLTTGRKLDRILFEQQFGEKIKHTEAFLKKSRKFKFPFKWRAKIRKANKKPNLILVWYLNAKGIIEPPRLYPIYSSDMIIIRNKPYQVDPRAFWRIWKYQCLLIKEIDRRPVSNLDYDEIKRRGDSTDSDEFIIKAAMKAFLGGKKQKPVNKAVIIIIGIIILGGIAYFMMQ